MEARQRHFNKRPLNFCPYQVGDKVWAIITTGRKGGSRSLSNRWRGPFVVVVKQSDVVYIVRKPGGRKLYTLHHDSLKRFIDRNPSLILEDYFKPSSPTSTRPQQQQPRQFVLESDSSEDTVFQERQSPPPRSETDDEDSTGTCASDHAECEPTSRQLPPRLRSRPAGMRDYHVDTDSTDSD